MKKIIIIIVIILIVGILGILGFFFMMPGPDLSQFEHLQEPQISTKPNLKVIVVKAKGSPNEIGGKAFGLLFKTYFKIKGVPKGPQQQAPRARWPISADTPQSEWVGLYAMPVPESVAELPEYEAEPGLTMELMTTWEYGEVAEILHIGPYDKEEPTIEKLHTFIEENSYEIVGLHEEEYLKGPGMFFKGNPEKYYTIIRYRVKKVEAE